MKENENPQHLKQEPKSKKPKTLIMAIAVCALLIIVGMCILVVLQNSDTDKPKDIWRDESNEYITIETAYCPLQFPVEYSENLEHMEVIDGEVTMEVFYMLYNDTKLELFRIYFGDAETGTAVGFLRTDNGTIPVTYTVSEYKDKDFSDDETKELHNKMMNGFGLVIDSICGDSRFSENSIIAPSEMRDADLTYWTVSLPKNMEWEENIEADTYQATFYGTIGDEKIKLYSIYLGDYEADTVLGKYLVDGEEKTVSVESYDLEQREDWSDDELSAAYRMMETINDVIQIITNSESYMAE